MEARCRCGAELDISSVDLDCVHDLIIYVDECEDCAADAQAKVETEEERVDDLESEVFALQERIEELENQLADGADA